MQSKTSLIITGLLCILCALAFPIWILGTPAVQNDYAKGWTLGFTSIIVTFAVSLALILRVRSKLKSTQIGSPASTFNKYLILSIAIALSFVLSIIRSFQIM